VRLLLLLLLTSSCAPSIIEDPECSSDFECQLRETCIDGFCVLELLPEGAEIVPCTSWEEDGRSYPGTMRRNSKCYSGWDVMRLCHDASQVEIVCS
jgi:hypothetical protein